MTTSVDETLAKYLSRPYPVRLNYSNEDQCWFVRYPDLPGCLADGQTPAQALENGEEAKALWIEGALESGQPVPEPSVEETEYSGRILVRVGKDVHRALALRAEQRGISMNQHIASILSSANAAAETIQFAETLFRQSALANLVTLTTANQQVPAPQRDRLVWTDSFASAVPDVRSVMSLRQGTPFQTAKSVEL